VHPQALAARGRNAYGATAEATQAAADRRSRLAGEGAEMTEELFREDAYLTACPAVVIAAGADGIILDRTVFYAEGGGQPGDRGILQAAEGRIVEIADCRRDKDSGRHLHVAAAGDPAFNPGDAVTASIDWPRRHRLMRMHTCLHLLSAVVDGAVTGGSVGEERSRLDFDLPEPTLDKDALEAALNRLIAADLRVSFSWISDAELAARPELVRTMSVKPPVGQGRVRLIDIAGTDLQPCGGTHVRATSEIGAVRIGKIEKKGRLNRRIYVHLEG